MREPPLEKRDYILGKLSDSARERIEERILADDSAFDEMLAEEDELIDSYVSDELSGNELRDFEAALRRSVRLRDRVELAEILLAGVTRASGPSAAARSSAPVWYTLAAAIAIVSLVGVWAFMQTRTGDVPTEAAKRRRVSPVVQPSPPPPQTASVSPEAAAPVTPTPAPAVRPIVPVTIVTFVLSGATTRGEEVMPRFDVPTDAKEVALHVDLEGETARLFDAIVRDRNGREVWTRHDLPMSQLGSSQGIEVRVPAGRLPAGSYELGVYVSKSGDDAPISFSEFRIARK